MTGYLLLGNSWKAQGMGRVKMREAVNIFFLGFSDAANILAERQFSG